MGDLRFGWVRLATGPRLHYAEQGDPQGEPVVLLHGWPDSWFTWSRVLSLLPPRLHVFAPDQRGFGESEKPETGYRIDDFGADALAFLDALGVERPTLVGHSFGTFVARQAAHAGPRRIARLVLIGSGFSPANPVTRELLAVVRGIQDPVSVEFARDFQAGTAYVPLPEPFFERLVAESMKMPAHVWRATLTDLLSYDDADRLGALAATTRLLWGDHDALFSRDDQDRLVEAIPGATLHVFAETGHCPNWERPERVAAELLAFL